MVQGTRRVEYEQMLGTAALDRFYLLFLSRLLSHIRFLHKEEVSLRQCHAGVARGVCRQLWLRQFNFAELEHVPRTLQGTLVHTWEVEVERRALPLDCSTGRVVHPLTMATAPEHPPNLETEPFCLPEVLPVGVLQLKLSWGAVAPHEEALWNRKPSASVVVLLNHLQEMGADARVLGQGEIESI